MLGLTTLLTSLALPCFSVQESAPSSSRGERATERIARIEQGLRPAVRLAGEPGWSLEDRMGTYGVPGVSVAVLDGGQVAWARAYGVADRATGEAATTETLFQSASISKPVSASAVWALLAERGETGGQAVNDGLEGWKLPEHGFEGAGPVTVAQLLGHHGGTTVHGFEGYRRGAELPAVTDILEGRSPANSSAVRVDLRPGTEFRYSGGGYTVMQKWVEDTTGEPFEEVLAQRVLGPIGMKSSSYAQPLPEELMAQAASGVLPNGAAVSGGSHVYPEQAAAGLWTTASDLARFGAEVQRALKGESRVFDRSTAENLVVLQEGAMPGGFLTRTIGGEPFFFHGGWNEGFSSLMVCHATEGYGAAVLLNGNFPELADEILAAIGSEYGWAMDGEYERQPLSGELQAEVCGRYSVEPDQAWVITSEGEELRIGRIGSDRAPLVFVGSNTFVCPSWGDVWQFETGADGASLRIGGPGRVGPPHPRLPDGQRVAREVLLEGDFEQTLDAYRELLPKAPGDGGLTEEYLNNEGYELMGSGQLETATVLFRVATELFPNSANAWDSLGEAFRTAGDLESSLAAYGAALELDPRFPTALQAVRELKAELGR